MIFFYFIVTLAYYCNLTEKFVSFPCNENKRRIRNDSGHGCEIGFDRGLFLITGLLTSDYNRRYEFTFLGICDYVATLTFIYNLTNGLFI